MAIAHDAAALDPVIAVWPDGSESQSHAITCAEYRAREEKPQKQPVAQRWRKTHPDGRPVLVRTKKNRNEVLVQICHGEKAVLQLSQKHFSDLRSAVDAAIRLAELYQ